MIGFSSTHSRLANSGALEGDDIRQGWWMRRGKTECGPGLYQVPKNSCCELCSRNDKRAWLLVGKGKGNNERVQLSKQSLIMNIHNLWP
jgi:hypothetical protein